MADYKILYPEYFTDLVWFELESKGWVSLKVMIEERPYTLNFYDPVRLQHEAAEEIKQNNLFFEENLLIVNAIKREVIEEAVEYLVNSGQVKYLIPHQ